jgi:hypothetical protein
MYRIGTVSYVRFLFAQYFVDGLDSGIYKGCRMSGVCGGFYGNG